MANKKKEKKLTVKEEQKTSTRNSQFDLKHLGGKKVSEGKNTRLERKKHGKIGNKTTRQKIIEWLKNTLKIEKENKKKKTTLMEFSNWKKKQERKRHKKSSASLFALIVTQSASCKRWWRRRSRVSSAWHHKRDFIPSLPRLRRSLRYTQRKGIADVVADASIYYAVFVANSKFLVTADSFHHASGYPRAFSRSSLFFSAFSFDLPRRRPHASITKGTPTWWANGSSAPAPAPASAPTQSPW